jgi:hypothetical protein
MKKKMKRFEKGGSIDEGVRARAMKFVEGLEGIKGSDIEDETGTVKGSIKRNEYGDLYDSEMKTTPKAAPKAAAPKREKVNPTYNAPPKMDAAERVKKEREKSAKKSSSRSESSGISDIVGAKKGGLMSSASKRADGCAVKGKTKGRMV